MYAIAIVKGRITHTLSGSPDSAACPDCSRTVRMVPVEGEGRLVAVEPEVIAVVAAGAHGGATPSGVVVNGRRLHAGLCVAYQREARREKTRQEVAAYERRSRKGGL